MVNQMSRVTTDTYSSYIFLYMHSFVDFPTILYVQLTNPNLNSVSNTSMIKYKKYLLLTNTHKWDKIQKMEE